MKYFTTLISTAIGVAIASPLAQRQTQCVGSLCDRLYSNVTWIGTHDSAFVGSIDDPTVNQEVSVTDQLNAGIRFLQAQTHTNDLTGTLDMCHTSCLLEDAGSLDNYLSTVKTWMDANPNNVLTMLLVNGDNVDVSEFDDAFSSSGLKDYAFVPSTSPNALTIDQWPTLGDMVTSGKRIVVFLDYGADESSVPYILSEFDAYIFETPYDTTDPSFAECSLNRPPGASPDGRMYLVNHFLDKDVLGADIPDNAADFTTNAATGTGSIGAQADLCTQTYGRVPNFILVDMFDRGDVFTAQQNLNFPS